MTHSLHHALFALLPLALAVAAIMKSLPGPVVLAQAVLRFGVGCSKWVLLISPLWETTMLVLSGGPENLGLGMAWVCFLSCLLCAAFLITCAGDLGTGLTGMLGFPAADRLTINLLTPRRLGGLVLLTPVIMLMVTLSPNHVWQLLKAMVNPPQATIASLFQEARVLSNFHVVTLVAGLAAFIGLPTSREFLRVMTPKKAAACLACFALAVAMLWTRLSPMS